MKKVRNLGWYVLSCALVAFIALSAFGIISFNSGNMTLADEPDPFTIPAEPPALDDLIEEVEGPGDIDQACDDLGISARLLNFNLAVPVDLTDWELGECTYIPVLISDREGGRKSLYYLENGEEVLAGIFVNSHGYIKRYTKRLTGTSVPAEEDDIYQERYVNHDETELLFKGQGPLTIEDFDIGKGYCTITPDSGFPSTMASACWILWSCILVVAK